MFNRLIKKLKKRSVLFKCPRNITKYSERLEWMDKKRSTVEINPRFLLWVWKMQAKLLFQLVEKDWVYIFVFSIFYKQFRF